MAQLADAWLERQRRRFTRGDAHRWLRADAERWLRLDWRKAYNPNQPRVPAGNPQGGRWVGEGGSVGRVISDATPDTIKPGDRLAQVRPPRRGQFLGATPGQNARFAAAEMRADAALRRVREVDPNWAPRVTSLTEPNSIEGAIGHAQARAEAAEARLRELARMPHDQLLESYRESNAQPDRAWSREKNTVAVCTADQQMFFGTNRNAPTRTEADGLREQRALDSMTSEFPGIMRRGSIDQWPNYSLSHAESNLLLRMADANYGTLAGRILDITVDRPMCSACERVLPYLGMRLGNPRIRWFDDIGLRGIMHFRDWEYWRSR